MGGRVGAVGGMSSPANGKSQAHLTSWQPAWEGAVGRGIQGDWGWGV